MTAAKRLWPRTRGEAVFCWPPEWGLGIPHSVFLTELFKRRPGATFEQLFEAMYFDDPNGGPEIAIVTVRISQLRQRAGIRIRNRVNVGYYIDPNDYPKLEAAYREGHLHGQ